ncbi:MAG: DUF421 domain-containing protein [Clostridia bacterium]|nr:DUF421 domain-containing protein [Clostridia bacterium]
MVAIVLRTVLLFFLLSFALKLMGKRQLGELEVGELVSALLISEVAVLPIDDPDRPLLAAILPVLCIVSLEVLLSFIKTKSPFLKRTIDGEPVYIIYKGKLRQSALRDNRLSLEELLAEMRVLGYTGIAEVDYAILEQNGKFSIVPKAEQRPLSKSVVTGTDGGMTHTLITDGTVKERTLTRLGYDHRWLGKQLSSYHTTVEGVFYMSVDDAGAITVIEKEQI